MFKASLEPMMEVKNDLHRNAMEMDECIDKLSRISSALKEFPYLEEVAQQISSESQKLEGMFTMLRWRRWGTGKGEKRHQGIYKMKSRKVRIFVSVLELG